jgi:ABC-2 type transport system permease protein
VLTAALAQAPAVWVLTGIVALGFGIASRAAVVGWGALVGFLLIGELGPLFRLSQGVMDLSPFAHVPKLPGAHFTATPLLWLTVLAAALVAVGLVAFRRRDVG